MMVMVRKGQLIEPSEMLGYNSHNDGRNSVPDPKIRRRTAILKLVRIMCF